MSALRMFIPITKVDAEKRLVYGIATGETEDRAGEICDYASTKPLYEKWSGDIAKATDGKSFGNVRAMHGKIAAGKVTALAFNDAAKQIEIAAKIVDDAEWKKVEEGVYTGFSQGGEYVKRWKDEATGLQRYTANPSEVSLVDLPCLPSATFQMIKAAGAVEERHFKPVVEANPSNDAVFAKASELAKAAGREDDVPAFFDPARAALVKAALPVPPELPKLDASAMQEGATPPVPAEGVEQVWKAKDGSTHAKKADAIAKNVEIDAKAAIDPATKGVMDQLTAIGAKLGIEKTAPATGDQQDGTTKPQTDRRPEDAAMAAHPKKKRLAPDGSTMKAATTETLAKDLYSASRFAELLASLRGVASSAEWDAFFGNRSDPEDLAFAEQMKGWIKQGCALLIAIVQSESDDLGDADEAMVLVAGAGLSPKQIGALGKAAADVPSLAKALPTLQKAGARNSKADGEKIQAMHDSAVDLGAKCGGDADKAHGHGDLTKAIDALNKATAERDALQKTIFDMVPMLAKIGERIENIEKQPLPLPFAGGVLRVAEKGGALPADVQAEIERLQKEDPDALRLMMLKAAQSQPFQMTTAR